MMWAPTLFACLSLTTRAPLSGAVLPRPRAELVATSVGKDYSGEASNTLNNVRTPAALLAGATFGSVFALQPAGSDAMMVGMAKRLHMLIGVIAFCAELISVLVSSVTLGRLGSESLAHRGPLFGPQGVHVTSRKQDKDDQDRRVRQGIVGDT